MAVSGYDIAAWAKQWVGTPYAWGGNSLSKGVDCSGLIQQVYKNFGINVSRTTYTQIGEGKAVGQHEMRAGDMVFFDTKPGGGPDHVGMYIGDGKMLHAPRPGKNVEITDLTTGYWQGLFMGARRVAGIEGGGVSDEWQPTDVGAKARLSPEELAAEYGWAYSFLNSIPELKPVFSKYVSENWSKEKFQAELRDTKWWKTNSDSMRKIQQMKKTDPATWQASLSAAKLQIQVLAAEMGAAIPSAKIGKIAEQALATGLDEAGLRNVLGGYITWTDKNTLSGQAGMFEHAMKEFAYANGVTLDRQVVKNQAQLVGRGLATEQDFKNQIVNQAASLYPAYTEQLMGGQTMMEIASPYIQQMADDLEIPDTQISLSDPLVRSALNGVNKQGKPVGMDLVTFQNVLRNDPRWGKTKKAQDSMMNTGLTVLKDMGFMGGKAR